MRSRLFWGCCLVWAGCQPLQAQPSATVQRAAAHAVECHKPAQDFFEGALLGNGAMGVVVTTRPDAVMQVGGRYSDLTDYMYMGRMGIWFENFALPAVINECLMQSYDGVIRLFPNWDTNTAVSFSTLRARGAFLVSASCAAGRIGQVRVLSEKGSMCRLLHPWPGRQVSVAGVSPAQVKVADGVVAFPTQAGREYVVDVR